MQTRFLNHGHLQQGSPEELFADSYYLAFNRGIVQLSGPSYDVTGDGERFLMVKGPFEVPTGPMDVVLVQNWFEELKRLVPTDSP